VFEPLDKHIATAAFVETLFGVRRSNPVHEVLERPRRTSLKAEVSMRSERLIRSDIERAAWQTSPVRIAWGRPQALNLGQLIRSIVLVAASVAIVAMISFEPAHHSAGGGARNERAASDRSHAALSFISPDGRIALDQPGTAPSADRARHAN
jgi:hypothetical protein